MTRYIAFLRGINVGGNKLIKMEGLARTFTAAGFRNVRTYLASGNVIFDSPSASKPALVRKIERVLRAELGYEVAVILRTIGELHKLVQRNPFKKYEATKDVMLCVVFLTDQPKTKPKLPLISINENLEVFGVANRAAFVVLRRKKTGWFGFPNNFVEKQLDVTGTTRQWRTVVKLLKAAESRDS